MATAGQFGARPANHGGQVLSTFVEVFPESEVPLLRGKQRVNSCFITRKLTIARLQSNEYRLTILAFSYLVRSDPQWLRSLLQAYNSAFAVGHSIMLAIVLGLCLIFAPFVGCAGALWAFMSSIARTLAASYGKHLSDALGYGQFVRTKAAYIAWQRNQAHEAGTSRSRLPEGGVRPSSRLAPVSESEFFASTDASGIRQLVRLFNILFSWGFVFGTVLCAVLTIIASPFVGMFVCAWDFAVSLLRVFSRSEGKLVTDIFGVTNLLDQATAKMMEEMGTTMDLPSLSDSFQPPFSPSGNNNGALATPIFQQPYTAPVAVAPTTAPLMPVVPAQQAYHAPPTGMYPGVPGYGAVSAPQQQYQSDDPSQYHK